MATRDFYCRDLAAIHAEAFEALAVAGAATLRRLAKRPPSRVLDLGCGAGRLSLELQAHGVRTWGVDISPDLLGLARRRLPGADFVQGSLVDTPLPEASAAAAIGEVLNYATISDADDLSRVFAKVHAALEDEGLFLFDLAGPGRVGAGRAFSHGQDWVVGMIAEEAAGILVRRITTFRRESDEVWRRSDEEHLLRLWPPDQVIALLKSTGFAGAMIDGYERLALPGGLHVYAAVKATCERPRRATRQWRAPNS